MSSAKEGKCIYVLFSRQNTRIGRVIRVFLRNSFYSHVSVALDGSLYQVYSFSRERHSSPFSGCFMREYPAHFLAFGKDVPIKLCRVELNDDEYASVMARLKHCKTHRKRMPYNLLDAAALPFHRRVRLADSYTCVGFASYLLGVDDMVSDIGSLEAMLEGSVVYEGSLSELLEQHGSNDPENDPYFEKRGLPSAIGDLFSLQRRVYRRWKNKAARIGRSGGKQRCL